MQKPQAQNHESSLKFNPFTICYDCETIKEVDSFERKRGSVFLNIDKKKDILFFYEFGFVDERLEDTISNKEWAKENFSSWQGGVDAGDTLQRPIFSNHYRFYYFKDTVSGFQQITCCYNEYYWQSQGYEPKVRIFSIIFKYNKVFSPYFHQIYPKQVADDYFADFNYIKSDFINKFKSDPYSFDTSSVEDINMNNDHSFIDFEEGYPKQIISSPYMRFGVAVVANHLGAAVEITTSPYSSWMVRGDSLRSIDYKEINKALDKFDYQIILSRGSD